MNAYNKETKDSLVLYQKPIDWKELGENTLILRFLAAWEKSVRESEQQERQAKQDDYQKRQHQRWRSQFPDRRLSDGRTGVERMDMFTSNQMQILAGPFIAGKVRFAGCLPDDFTRDQIQQSCKEDELYTMVASSLYWEHHDGIVSDEQARRIAIRVDEVFNITGSVVSWWLVFANRIQCVNRYERVAPPVQPALKQMILDPGLLMERYVSRDFVWLREKYL